MLLIPCLAGRPLELDEFLAEKEALLSEASSRAERFLRAHLNDLLFMAHDAVGLAQDEYLHGDDDQ